jgi:orotidine-5'-phosphate decarboxylase
LAADAITVSPYLGFGSLRPMVDTALAVGAGLFVLTLTSNPEGAFVQRAVGADGRSVAQVVIDEIAQVNAHVEPLGDIGAVIGATVGHASVDLTELHGPVLAPGLGAQGGRPEDLRRIFGAALAAVLASTSREILSRGPAVADLRAAADRAVVELRDNL